MHISYFLVFFLSLIFCIFAPEKAYKIQVGINIIGGKKQILVR